jgi:GWxTD domain-containing protein
MAGRLAGAALQTLLCAAPPAAVGAQKAYSPEELFQPFLGAELSQWLVGPIARLATEQEIDDYLRLKSDDDARAFVDQFWARRDADPARPGNPLLELYDRRAAEADKKFSEAAVAGRRTDRGTIHILYGAPETVEYEEFQDVSGPDVELWRYPKQAEAGLDGRRPQREYRFAKLDDLTRFFSARDLRDPRRRRDASEPGFPSGGPGDPVPGEPRLPGEPP